MSKLRELAKKGWDEVEEAGTFKQLPIGVYPLKIVEVIDNPQEEFIEVLIDIVKGEYKDYFANLQTNEGVWNWRGKFRKYYRDNTMSFFKGFITSIERSNEGYSFVQTEGDVQKLVGKYFYGVFEYQETTKVNDEGKPTVNVLLNDRIHDIPKFNEGKVPEPQEDYVKPLNDWGKDKFQENLIEWKKENKPKDEYVAASTDDDDLPF